MNAFLEQHYLDHPIPGKILVNLPADEEVASALAEVATRPVPIVEPERTPAITPRSNSG